MAPRRQIDAFFLADVMPFAPVSTHRETESIAAGRNHAQMHQRRVRGRDDRNGLVQAILTPPDDNFSVTGRDTEGIVTIAEGRQSRQRARFHAARVGDGRYHIIRGSRRARHNRTGHIERMRIRRCKR